MEKEELKRYIDSRITYYKLKKEAYQQACDNVKECNSKKGIPACFMCNKVFECEKLLNTDKNKIYYHDAAVKLADTIIKYKDKIKIEL